MTEILTPYLAVYWYLFKWQFANPWFYAWVALFGWLGWKNQWKTQVVLLAIWIVVLPIFNMLLKYDVLFGN